MKFVYQVLFICAAIFSLALVQGDDCSSESSKQPEWEVKGLQSYKTCGSLRKSPCMYYHDAEKECPCTCEKRKKEGDPDDGNSDDGKGDDGKGNDSGKDGSSDDSSKGNGKSKGDGCFNGDALVMTTQGEVKMSDLVNRKDVQVLSRNSEGQLGFSNIVYWIHAEQNVQHDFYVLKTESGHHLTLTPLHLVYETDCQGNSKAVFAENVQVDKCLFVNQDGQLKESKVIDKIMSRETGFYGPLTENGNIVVNDVLASCFSNVESEEIQKIMYSYLLWARNVLAHIMPSQVSDLIYSAHGRLAAGVLGFLDLASVTIH